MFVVLKKENYIIDSVQKRSHFGYQVSLDWQGKEAKRKESNIDTLA